MGDGDAITMGKVICSKMEKLEGCSEKLQGSKQSGLIHLIWELLCPVIFPLMLASFDLYYSQAVKFYLLPKCKPTFGMIESKAGPLGTFHLFL